MCMKTARNNNCQLTIFVPDFLVSLFHLCLPVSTEHFLMSHAFTDNNLFTPLKHSPESHDLKPVWAGSSLTWAFLPPDLCCFCVMLWRKLIWSWATMQQGQTVALSGQVNQEMKLQIETMPTWTLKMCTVFRSLSLTWVFFHFLLLLLHYIDLTTSVTRYFADLF